MPFTVLAVGVGAALFVTTGVGAGVVDCELAVFAGVVEATFLVGVAVVFFVATDTLGVAAVVFFLTVDLGVTDADEADALTTADVA